MWGDLEEVGSPSVKEALQTPYTVQQASKDTPLRSTLPVLPESLDRPLLEVTKAKVTRGPVTKAAIFDPTIPRASMRVPNW